MCDVCEWLSKHTVGGDDTIAVIALPDGTAVIATRTHKRLLDETPAVQQAFLRYANEVSIMLYETLQAHGTNVIVDDFDHAHLQVIPRFDNDGLPFTWEGKRTSPAELQTLAKKISDEAWVIGKRGVDEPRTNPVLEAPLPERIGEPLPEAVPVKKPDDVKDRNLSPPADITDTDLGDIAHDVQRKIDRGPTEERDYRIRNLTRRR